MRALLSVADRAGIADLARELLDQGVEVYATDGTRTELSEAGVEVSPVSELTDMPELIGGQVRRTDGAVAKLARSLRDAWRRLPDREEPELPRPDRFRRPE